MGTVTVRGAASASVRPDQARLLLTVTEIDHDQATALEWVTAQANALDSILSELGVPERARTTSGVQVREEREWRKDHHELVGYRATVSIAVTVRDLGLLGRLIARAVSEGGARVAGPWWEVDDDNPAVLAMLGDAARDARRRAETYAGALGLRLGAVEAISETPFEASAPEPRHEAMMAMSMAKTADDGGGDDVPVSPGEVDLSAEVHVRFALLPG